MMPSLLLFLVSCVLGGIGGAVGSMAGHAAGPRGLWIGGVIGGLVGCVAAAAIARARRWIEPAQFGTTSLGASIGFLIAVAIAVNTLSSPIGPVLSTALIGIGAVVGSRLTNR